MSVAEHVATLTTSLKRYRRELVALVAYIAVYKVWNSSYSHEALRSIWKLRLLDVQAVYTHLGHNAVMCAGVTVALAIALHISFKQHKMNTRRQEVERVGRMYETREEMQRRLNQQAAQAVVENTQRTTAGDDSIGTQSNSTSEDPSRAGTSEAKAAAGERQADNQKAMSREEYLAKLQAMTDEAAAKHAAAQAAARAAAAEAAAQAKAAATAAENATPTAGSSSNSATAAVSRHQTSDCDAVAVASGAGNGSKQDGNGDGSSGIVGRATATESRMIPREVAQQAEEQQRRWLDQLNSQSSSAPWTVPDPVLEQSRSIRMQQDAEYHASLVRDRVRQDEEAAQQEERRRIAKRLQELQAMKLQFRDSLPEEPPAPETLSAAQDADNHGQEHVADGSGPSDAGTSKKEASVVTIRVRLPDGSTRTRRWLPGTAMAQVYNWVHSIDAFPLWEPSSWQLVTSFPRAVVPKARQVGEDRSGGDDGEPLLLKDAVGAGEDSLSLLVEKL